MLVRKFFQGPSFLSFQSLMSFEANPESLGGGSGEMGTEETSGVSQGQEETPGYSSFVQEILKGAPPEHVSLMEPYIKKFDAGVTRRFQDLNNQYKPYANLGWDEDTASQMAEIYRVINEEPERLYYALRDQLDLAEEAQNGESVGSESDSGFQELPAEFMNQFNQQQQALEALAQIVLDNQRAQAEANDDREYDNYLNLLRQEYGDFDERYVHSLISNGMDGEAAVKQWQEMLNTALQQAAQSTDGLPPAVLSSAGGGAIPQGQSQNLGQIPSKDIRNLIANVMGQTHQAGA